MTNSAPIKVLMIDDDKEFSSLVKEFLTDEKEFDVTTIFKSIEGVEWANRNIFDIIILDVGMPELNGFQALKRIRETCDTPVIMLTARGDHIDRVIGLEFGADDYVPKPCDLRELAARLRAIHRRFKQSQANVPVKEIVIDNLKLVQKSHSVFVNDELVSMTGTEYLVLEVLVMSAGEIVDKNNIAMHALNRKITAFDRSVDVHVGNLRKKLGPQSDGQQRIKTIRGRGYLYVK
ncbi:response regulator transcription factor [Thalassomonas viridans]|uniref:Response regulator transcription factor n=1 Tax=Thalassomonas viridans TaxID=137584 RepID=A0AAE9ZBC4_9GAMM|nr:response regulator transcription factor [Thalassomonas viridans]WDE09064.1 response regulator transcription factor [Thalassomonas viridans]